MTQMNSQHQQQPEQGTKFKLSLIELAYNICVGQDVNNWYNQFGYKLSYLTGTRVMCW